jgi:alpha/beta superfamily hydrolase
VNIHSQKIQLQGGAGNIEALRDAPAGPNASRGVVVVTHPHPLFGGAMNNKVVQTLARAFVQSGWTALRFNFRGVGASQGVYDAGRGELDDLLAVIEQVAPQATGPALALAGFSFGSFVASHAVARLWEARPIDKLVLVGVAASRFDVAPVPATLHLQTLVLHGERDDTVPLTDVLDWARPQGLPVTVVPGVEHFFHGQLPLLKNLVLRHLKS